MQDFADRVAKLEKSNRNMRVACGAALLFYGVAFLSGADTKSNSKTDVLRTD